MGPCVTNAAPLGAQVSLRPLCQTGEIRPSRVSSDGFSFETFSGGPIRSVWAIASGRVIA
jgi:hypothetical protein